MINNWELKFSPLQKYPKRYRLRLKCTPEDIEEVKALLKEELKVDISPPFQSLSSDYNWGIYVYELEEELKNKVVSALQKVCSDGKIIEDDNQTMKQTIDGPKSSEGPTDFTNILSDIVKKMTEKFTVSEELTQQRTKQELLMENIFCTPLNARYTFENFVVGPNNRFTHAAAMAVSENPGKTYNPLFIYGGVGLGKTHLMQAIGNYVKKKRGLSKIGYITSEKFVSQVIEAIRGGYVDKFRESFANLDMLLVDDVQFLAQSESTQEEFFHIFNMLHNYSKQLVITSDRPPKLLTTLEDRLRSRFEWGLIADIKSPSLETRIAILKKKGEDENVNLDDNILLYIASKLVSNIRELEGFLKRINAYAGLTNQPVDIKLVKKIMSELLPEENLSEEEKELVKNEKETQKEAQEVKQQIPLNKISFESNSTKKIQEKTKPLSIDDIYNSASVLKKEEQKNQISIQENIPLSSEIKEEDFYQEYEFAVNTIEAAFFYPENKTQEIYTVKQKFADVIKKHNLKYKIVTVFDRPYNLENINYKMFLELCKTNNVTVCIVLSPYPDAEIKDEDFYANILPLFENSGISFEYVPWKDLNKEYRYLNLALDIVLSKFKLE